MSTWNLFRHCRQRRRSLSNYRTKTLRTETGASFPWAAGPFVDPLMLQFPGLIVIMQERAALGITDFGQGFFLDLPNALPGQTHAVTNDL